MNNEVQCSHMTDYHERIMIRSKKFDRDVKITAKIWCED